MEHFDRKPEQIDSRKYSDLIEKGGYELQYKQKEIPYGGTLMDPFSIKRHACYCDGRLVIASETIIGKFSNGEIVTKSHYSMQPGWLFARMLGVFYLDNGVIINDETPASDLDALFKKLKTKLNR